jgi:hypothetical protein
VCWNGRIASDQTFAEVLGTTVAKVAEWRERLAALGYLKFDDLGKGCTRLWLHKKFNQEVGNYKERLPQGRVN